MPLPVIIISGDSVICSGESATLTASGANSYLWNNGSSGQSIVVTPLATSVYTVHAANSLGTCFGSQSVTVSVIDCTTETGLTEWYANGGLAIYPNPTSGKLIIETKKDIRISLHDGLGRAVLEETLEKGDHTLDLSGYSSGIYLLKTNYNGVIKITKLVKKD